MQNKKILVTGGAGFLGSHLADILDKTGNQVVLFDKNPSKYKKHTMTEFVGDIMNIKDIREAIKGCEYVYHFAAQADIDNSYQDPSSTIKNNIIGTQNLLEVCKETEIKRFIFSSTIYVYSDLGSFYRVSKQACEKIIEEYSKQYGLSFSILRFGSLYGPRANYFNGIQKYLLEAIQKKQINRRGDGEEVRQYIHVFDAARLSQKAMLDKYKNKYLTITGQESIKVKNMLQMINEILGGNIQIRYGKEKNLNHYSLTPYSYRPNISLRITPETHIDLGQGLLNQIYQIKDSLKNKDEMTLRERR